MSNKTIPLKDITIHELYNGEPVKYEIPIYQRNYAWEKDEIAALIHDVYNAFSADKEKKRKYYIGTLVTFHKGDQVFEVIDGQQRLTTIFLILRAMKVECKNHLTYKARRNANSTIESLDKLNKVPENKEDIDYGIERGFNFAISSLEIASDSDKVDFTKYFQENVHIIHYQVPKDIDLNHYFEVMNSRGEQLEMSEIIKARLMEKLADADKAKFNRLWECCSEMNVYVQQKYSAKTENMEDIKKIFGKKWSDFKISDFDELPPVEGANGKRTINNILDSGKTSKIMDDDTKGDSFQPIMDFPNFLLIVLKLTKIEDEEFKLEDFILDDKELLNQFSHDKVKLDECFVKKFGYNLLKAKFLLDNFVVHHSCEDDTSENNPWKLQKWQNDGEKYCVNLAGNSDLQEQLVHLLSMFEVSFTAKQRKNYLFYCLLYLFDNYKKDLKVYRRFLSNLAGKYFWDVYMVQDNLNDRNVPRPGCFDQVVLPKKELNVIPEKSNTNFNVIYGDGSSSSKGIPLFIFNYLDYKIWEKYLILRGKKIDKDNLKRKSFFDELGCSDFGLDFFDQFYFSRTRRSLEHYFPQANVNGSKELENKINCFGNYAMIGTEANSSGSNWTPKTKLDHYLDSSNKIRTVSVASLKFRIMMQKCKDREKWDFEDIEKHQEKMLKILGCKVNSAPENQIAQCCQVQGETEAKMSL